MLYREIIAVCSEIHTKLINTLCGRIVEFVNVKPDGTYSDHWALHVYKFTASGLRQTVVSVCVCHRWLLLFVSLWGRSRIWRQNGANFADLFVYWKLLFSISQEQEGKKDLHSSVRKFWSQFSTRKSYKFAVYGDDKLVSKFCSLSDMCRQLVLLFFRSSVLPFFRFVRSCC